MTPDNGRLAMKPHHLSANNFRHFYQGGPSIAAFRGQNDAGSDSCPEDWIGSTTTRFGDDRFGLSTLPDGRVLRDAIQADGASWLGADHVQRFGNDPGILVKLLDAQQRLIVHTHPNREFARQHLGCTHGKTEAWLILSTSGAEANVYVGFKEDVSADLLAKWVGDQQTVEMLSALNQIAVKPGDVILVPAGVPHAVGAGIFIAEIQEPTDFSLTLEWAGFDLDGPTVGHLGLGFELALTSVDRSAWPPARLACLFGPPDDGSSLQDVLPVPAYPFFRVERARDGASMGASFAVVIVTDGWGWLSTSEETTPIKRGDTLVVPYGAGPTAVTGAVTLLRFVPPAAFSADIPAPAV